MSVAADASQDRIVACNGNDVPVVTQPTTRRGLRIYKIVVLGDGGVGKSGISCLISDIEMSNLRRSLSCNEACFSAVTLQFVSHTFLDYHDPTIGKLCFHISKEEKVHQPSVQAWILEESIKQ